MQQKKSNNVPQKQAANASTRKQTSQKKQPVEKPAPKQSRPTPPADKAAKLLAKLKATPGGPRAVAVLIFTVKTTPPEAGSASTGRGKKAYTYVPVVPRPGESKASAMSRMRAKLTAKGWNYVGSVSN